MHLFVAERAILKRVAPFLHRLGDKTGKVFHRILLLIVIDVQQRLMELNYMDYDEPTNYYGSITTEAVKLFQRRNGLEVTGEIREADYSLLMSNSARKISSAARSRAQS